MTDQALKAIVDLAKARLKRPPEEGNEDVAKRDPDAEILALAEGAPAPLRELFEIAAKHLHVDLGNWEIWSGHLTPNPPDCIEDASAPDGFDPAKAVAIAGTGGGERYAVLNWTPAAYRLYLWDTENGEVTDLRDFGGLLDHVRGEADDMYDDEMIQMVKDSQLPGLLEKAGRKAWTPPGTGE
jgi:hypothetical protein